MAHTPAASKISNAPFCDYWSCPTCYADMFRRDGYRPETTVACPGCDARVELSIELQPVYVAALPEPEEHDDGE